MLYSMTSYGRASSNYDNRNIVVELKTLNSKFLDLRLKMPSNFQARELEVRKMMGDQLQRGKVEVTITYEGLAGGESYQINEGLFKEHYETLRQITSGLSIPNNDIVAAILRIPEVVSTAPGTVTEEEWNVLHHTIAEAIKQVKQHRQEEGASMENDLLLRINNITQLLLGVDQYEAGRVDKIKERIRMHFKDHKGVESFDESRMEQELFYYIEKLDITEEKVRLQQHCKYFLDEMQKDYIVKGKKLNFISQEIGREINTLGAKAYSSEIQKLVVDMKNELEKIKEQLSNTL